MKKLTLLMCTLALVGISSLFMSCEGPAGPAGANGTNGQNGNATCGVCHSDNATSVNLKFAQYDLSQHNKGIIYEEEAGRVQCGGCHTGDGFAEAAALGQDDAVTHATSKIDCRACHTIHKNYDTTDFTLRITAGFALRQTGVAIDQNKGNLCAKCHQARSYVRTVPDTVKASGSGSPYSRFGPHYGVVANVVTMNGPVQITGSTAYPTSNPHASLPKGCVSCHMGSDPANPAVGGHTFLMPTANLSVMTSCQTCHDATTIKNAVNAAQNAKDIATYRRLLIDKGMLDTTSAVLSDGTYQVLGEYFATPGGKTRVFTNPKDVDVVLNYLYIAKDRSRGIHNPKYVQALIKNGLEYLNQ